MLFSLLVPFLAILVRHGYTYSLVCRCGFVCVQECSHKAVRRLVRPVTRWLCPVTAKRVERLEQCWLDFLLCYFVGGIMAPHLVLGQ